MQQKTNALSVFHSAEYTFPQNLFSIKVEYFFSQPFFIFGNKSTLEYFWNNYAVQKQSITRPFPYIL